MLPLSLQSLASLAPNNAPPLTAFPLSPPSIPGPTVPPGRHTLGLLDAFQAFLVVLLALSGRHCRGFVQDLGVRGGEGEGGEAEE